MIGTNTLFAKIHCNIMATNLAIYCIVGRALYHKNTNILYGFAPITEYQRTKTFYCCPTQLPFTQAINLTRAKGNYLGKGLLCWKTGKKLI
jgi:hypothetical protein